MLVDEPLLYVLLIGAIFVLWDFFAEDRDVFHGNRNFTNHTTLWEPFILREYTPPEYIRLFQVSEYFHRNPSEVS